MPGFVMKDIGITTIGIKGPDDNSTLKLKKFVVGDYLDVSIAIPRNANASGRDDRDRSDGRRGRQYSEYR